MSPIGRIFVVLNLLLAAVFLGWASNVLTASEDTRAELAACEAEMTQTTERLESEASSLSARLTEQESAAAKFREERDQNQTRADRAEADLAQQQEENAGLRSTIASNTEKLADYNSRLETLLDAKDRAVTEARETQAALTAAEQVAREAESAKRDAEDSAAASEALIADLETKLAAARSEVQRLQSTVDDIMHSTNLSLNDFQAVPRIDATILDVRDELDLVALNVGDRDGVQRGMTFSIYRGHDYKGKVRIEQVEEFQSSAIVSRPSPSMPISKGDRATTQL